MVITGHQRIDLALQPSQTKILTQLVAVRLCKTARRLDALFDARQRADLAVQGRQGRVLRRRGEEGTACTAKAQVQVECNGVQIAIQVECIVQPKHIPEIKASPQVDRMWEIDGGGEEFRAGGDGRGTAHCRVGRQ